MRCLRGKRRGDRSAGTDHPYASAILAGTAAEVTDAAEKVNALRLLCRKLAPENPCWQGDFHDCIGHTAVWRITVAEITGKANRGKPE